VNALVNMATNLDPSERDIAVAKLIMEAIQDHTFLDNTVLNLSDSFST
jgi:hypothetical protein